MLIISGRNSYQPILIEYFWSMKRERNSEWVLETRSSQETAINPSIFFATVRPTTWRQAISIPYSSNNPANDDSIEFRFICQKE